MVVMNVKEITERALDVPRSFGEVTVQIPVLVTNVPIAVCLMDYVKNVRKATGANIVKTGVIWLDVNIHTVTKLLAVVHNASRIIGETRVIIHVKLKTVNATLGHAQNQPVTHAMSVKMVTGAVFVMKHAPANIVKIAINRPVNARNARTVIGTQIVRTCAS